MNKNKNVSTSPLFLRGRKRGGCQFTLIAAVSLDGRITRGNKEGTDWTSRADKQWFHKEADRYDAVIMGRKTFDAVSRPLTSRNRIVFSQTRSFCCSQEHQHNRCTIGFSGSSSALQKLLGRQRWSRIAVLGGTQIYDWFLKRNLVSELYLTLEPVIFGSGKSFSSQLFKPPRHFRLFSIKRLNPRGTLFLYYKK